MRLETRQKSTESLDACRQLTGFQQLASTFFLSTLGIRHFHNMKYTQLVVLLALAVAAAVVQLAVATAPISAYTYSQSSLRQARRGDGNEQLHDVAESTEVLDSYAITDNIHHRQLQHGRHRAVFLPPCPFCRIHGKFFFHLFWKGHCRLGGFRFTCIRKNFFKFIWFYGFAPPIFFSPAAIAAPLAPNRTSTFTATASRSEEILMIAEISDNGTSTVVPAVGCFSDADCELSASGLAAVNGSVPVSRRGVVTAECIGADLEERVPGVCVCPIRTRPVTGGDGGAQKFDICVRRASFEAVTISTDSSGSARLVNSTARGNVTLDVDLIEIEPNVPEDYEPTGEPIDPVEGFAIMSSATRFSRRELAGTDDDEFVDDDISASRPAGDVTAAGGDVVMPDPAPLPGPAPANPPPPSTDLPVVTPAPIPVRIPLPAPAPAPVPTPSPPIAPAPTPLAQAEVRGGVSGASRRSVISEEVDFAMRVRRPRRAQG